MKKAFFFIVLTILTLSMVAVYASNIQITLDKQEYVVGETVTITYSDADGDAEAWFAIYPQGEEPYQSYPGTEKVWAYANSNSEQAGSEPVTEGTVTLSTEGLAPGEYRCSYFVDNGYNVGATVTLKIVEESTNPETSDAIAYIPFMIGAILSLMVLKRKAVNI